MSYVMIIGHSGSGKTSSFIPKPNGNPPIKGFLPEEILFFTTNDKKFSGRYSSLYAKRVVHAKSLYSLKNLLFKFYKNCTSDKYKDIKAIVVDDLNLAPQDEYLFNKTNNTFEHMREIGELTSYVFKICTMIYEANNKIIPFITMHASETTDGTITYKTVGNLLAKHMTPEARTNYIFLSKRESDINDKITYKFYSNLPDSITKAPDFFTEEEGNCIANDARIIYERLQNLSSPDNTSELENELREFFNSSNS